MIEKQTIETLLTLPVSTRLALIEALWDSLSGDAVLVPVPDWHREILEQRLLEDDADTSAGLSWTAVRHEIEGGV